MHAPQRLPCAFALRALLLHSNHTMRSARSQPLSFACGHAQVIDGLVKAVEKGEAQRAKEEGKARAKAEKAAAREAEKAARKEAKAR